MSAPGIFQIVLYVIVLVALARPLGEVLGPGRFDDTRALRVCLKNLRQKLEPDPSRPRYIVTEAGLGYRLRVGEAQ